MRTLAFDGQTGASGDMLLGALLDVGGDRAALQPVEVGLEVQFAVESVRRRGVTATSVEVRRSDGEPVEGADDDHRTYPEVVDLVESLSLPEAVEAVALGTIERLGRAEAAVHGTGLAETHFHAVGADDAIADITGVALLMADLAVDRVVVTPVAAGGGEVDTSHGTYPVPPPAVIEIATDADWTLHGGPLDAELLTPTGAALLAELAEGVTTLPPMTVEAVGVGAGDHDFADRPNVLRALVGEPTGGLTRDEITVLETNLDDATPEVLGSLHETLAAAGARDVTVLPATMKKARPGHLVKVVVRPADAERVARRLATETGTLGIREVGGGHRWIAERRFVTATLSVDEDRYEVTVKIASDAEGEPYDVSAEYDDVVAVARATGLPVRDIARRAETAVRDGGALGPVLVHIVEADDWRGVEDRYAPPSLGSEGFIHLSTPTRAIGVAQYNFGDATEPLLLAVDRERIEADLKYEETVTGAFPHLYAELDVGAVLDIYEFPREEGRYLLPEELHRE